jgi:hypothetical protein
LLLKSQSEKIVKNGLYSSMGLLERFNIPGGTPGVPHDTLLSGMLFEYAVLLLAYVNPVFCCDATVFQKVLAKGKSAENHYYLLPEELAVYRNPVGVVVYCPGDGIFFYNARVLQTSIGPGALAWSWPKQHAMCKNQLDRDPGLLSPPLFSCSLPRSFAS